VGSAGREEEAFSLSETIRLSIRNAMIMDRRDEYQRIIDDVAQRKGIAEVRIFNKQGVITVSSDKSKVGTVSIKRLRLVTDATAKERRSCFCHLTVRPAYTIKKNKASSV
jgi:hypothetical protein